MVDFPVTDLGDPEDAVDVGEKAPAFTRPLVGAEFWEDVSLSSFETPVVLVFYPMDGAFPATYTWNELRDRAIDDTYDVEILGLSVSDPYGHKRLIEERGMDYRLFSDPNNGVARAFGISHELDGMTGIEEPRPATYLIDEDDVIRYRWVATEWPEFPDYDDLEAAVADLID
jgi:peroxiredoxin